MVDSKKLINQSNIGLEIRNKYLPYKIYKITSVDAENNIVIATYSEHVTISIENEPDWEIVK